MLTRITDPARGARNLLLHCAAARRGERLLVAYEPTDHGYYGTEALHFIRQAAEEIGLAVTTMNVGFTPDAPCLKADLLARMETADITVFLARLGDQLRFSDMPKNKRVVVSFALDAELLGSPFGTTHHAAMQGLTARVGDALRAARRVRVTCARGTDFSGTPHLPPAGVPGDTTLMRFPLSVFQPVPARTFSGRVALCGFLTGTGSLYYEGYTLEFAGQVHAVFERGRLSGFEGAPGDVAAAEAQYTRVAARFGIDRNAIHSWHAGIHPGCGYPWPACQNFERWGGAAFGNPRLLHFHTCGAYAPGEISWNMVDPTIEIDGIAVWENGVFHADRLAGGADILARYPCAAATFADPDRRVGLP
ncbi:MAG: hypothetical protein AAGG09_02070 [Pseudomonadota bacterium]